MIFIVPSVNWDGYAYLSKQWRDTSVMSYLRKNRHVYPDQNACDPDLQGVDLSRNYGYKFAYDDDGSSPDVCADDYRGPKAFSEPET